MSQIPAQFPHSSLAKKFDTVLSRLRPALFIFQEADKYFPNLVRFLSTFYDNEEGWVMNPSPTFKDTLSHPLHAQLCEILQNFLDIGLETLNYALSTGFDGSEAMSKVKARYK